MSARAGGIKLEIIYTGETVKRRVELTRSPLDVHTMRPITRKPMYPSVVQRLSIIVAFSRTASIHAVIHLVERWTEKDGSPRGDCFERSVNNDVVIAIIDAASVRSHRDIYIRSYVYTHRYAFPLERNLITEKKKKEKQPHHSLIRKHFESSFPPYERDET